MEDPEVFTVLFSAISATGRLTSVNWTIIICKIGQIEQHNKTQNYS
jgi:hypothetical protein